MSKVDPIPEILLEQGCYSEELHSKVEQIVAHQVTEARINELEHLTEDPDYIHPIVIQYIRNRLSELRESGGEK